MCYDLLTQLRLLPNLYTLPSTKMAGGAAGGGRGTSSRGRGGKFKKYTRGGGHHFSRNLQPLDADGNAISMWDENRKGKDDGDDDDDDDSSEEEEDSDEEDSDDDDAAAAAAKEEASREARKAQKKARKEAAIAKAKGKTVEVGDMPSSDEDDEDEDDDMPANPNHSKAARKQAAKAPAVEDDVDQVTDGVKKLQAGNRKEREALEAAAAKERYMKLQAQGKTDEAKADLARLKVIREQRAAEAARRQAEKEEREAQEKEKRAQIEAREARKREAAAAPKKASKKK